MKKVYLILTLNALSAGFSAQTFDWAKAEGLYAYDYGYGIDTDNSGNVYVAGKYEEVNADFSGTKVPCSGNHDGFLVKYAPDGSLQWIRTMGGEHGDYAQALYCDKANFVYIAGEIESATANTPIHFPGSTTTLNCVGDNDIFLAKYDLAGNLIWAKSEGSGKSEKALGVCSDKDGNVLICGYYTESTKINGQTITGKLSRNIFVAKYDKDGNFLWFKDAGSDLRDEAKAVKCDSDGNVYICGMYRDGCQFGSTTLTTFKSSSYWDAFLAKYDPNGNLQWVKTGGGDIDDGAWSMVIDAQNSIYISGEFGAYAEFNKKPIVSPGDLSTYIARYNPNGDLVWVQPAGSDKVDRSRGLGTDGTHIFITGQYGGTAKFGGAGEITAGDTSDIYIACLDKDGLFKWAVSVGGVKDKYEDLGYESGNGVTGFANGPNGAVYATGGLLDGGAFGDKTITKVGTRTDAFVTKISWNTGMPSIPVSVSMNDPEKVFSVFPNPGKGIYHVDLTKTKETSVTATVYNCIGQIICTENCSGLTNKKIDISSQPEGVYFLEISAGQNIIGRAKLIQQH